MDYLGNITNNKSISIKEITDTHCKQYTTMPTASIDLLDKIVQYIGTTTSDYTNGYFYKCIEDTGTYKWNNVEVQDNSGAYLPLDGSEIMTGPIQFNTTNTAVLIKTANTNKTVYITSAPDQYNGAALLLRGKTDTQAPGQFKLMANNSTDTVKELAGSTDGTLTWNSKNIFLADGSVNLTGTITSTNIIAITRSVNNSYLALYGGNSTDNGAALILNGSESTDAGKFTLRAKSSSGTAELIGDPNGILSWNNVFHVHSLTNNATRATILDACGYGINIFSRMTFASSDTPNSAYSNYALFVFNYNVSARILAFPFASTHNIYSTTLLDSEGNWGDWVAK